MRSGGAVLLGLAAVVLLGGFTLPGTVQRLWRKADRAVARKEYATATQLYEQAQQLRPQEWALRYNAAVAAAMDKQYDKALPGLQAIAKDGAQELREPAEFNLGNCYLAQGKTKEAVEHYKRALYLKPDDMNAKWNLELAKRKQQQQQKQQQDNKQQQQKQQQKPKPQPKDQQQQKQPRREMSQDEARRLLQSLSQQDRDLQKQMRQPKQPARESRPEKDW